MEGCIMVRLCTMNSCEICFNIRKLKWWLLQAAAVEQLTVIHVTGQNYRWLPEVQNAITSNTQRHIVLVAQGEPLCGIVGLVNCIRREQGSDLIRLQLCYFNIFHSSKKYHTLFSIHLVYRVWVSVQYVVFACTQT